MNRLRELQRDFLRHLLSGDDGIADAVLDGGAVGRDTRLAIYRNAYRVRLRETIETDHPILGLYLGDAGFGQMVQDYIDACPSHLRSLRHYADQLPAFLRANQPFSAHPEIAELAAFERRLLTSFDAADAERAGRIALAGVEPTRWPGIRLRFHPSVQPFVACWNSVEIWRALKAGQTPPQATPQPHSAWLLWRATDRLTQFRSMPPDEREALQHFLTGGDFAGACELLLLHHPDTVARRALSLLAGWLDQGIVQRVVAG